MAGSVNKAIILGNVGRDPEIRAMSSGDRIANLSIATSESWKDKATGERKERTEWHRVVIMNDAIVGIVERFVTKGDKLYVEGQIQTRKWQDQGCQDRYSTEIVVGRFNGSVTLLGGKSDAGEQRTYGERRDAPEAGVGASASRAAIDMQRPAAGGRRPAEADLDDSIPFSANKL